MAVTTESRPKEVDNVLLRVPSGLRKRIAEVADEENLSQNTFMTTSLLLAILAHDPPKIGEPQNLMALLAEIDRAAATDSGVAIGAFHVKDWEDVESVLKTLVEAHVVENLVVRKDPQAQNTVAYSFQLSKLGRAQWKLVDLALRMVFQRLGGDTRKEDVVEACNAATRRP